MKSEVMDWPECPSDMDFRMLATSLRRSLVVMGRECERPIDHINFAELRFRHTGYGEQDEESGMYIEEMELISVSPEYWYHEGQDVNLKEKV
jgi:hypothetical protein